MWMLGLYNAMYAEAIRNGYGDVPGYLTPERVMRNAQAWARAWLNRHQFIRWIDT